MINPKEMVQALESALPDVEDEGWRKAEQVLIELCSRPKWYPEFYAPDFPLLGYFLTRLFINVVGLPETTILNEGRYVIYFGTVFEPRAAVSIIFSEQRPEAPGNIIWIHTGSLVVSLQAIIAICVELAERVKEGLREAYSTHN